MVEQVATVGYGRIATGGPSDTKDGADAANKAAMPSSLLPFFGLLGFELLSELPLASGEFGGNVGPLKRSQDLAAVRKAHGGKVLEKRNKLDQCLIGRRAGPFGKNDGVFRLVFGMAGVGIDHDDFGEVAVEVREVLS